MSRRGGHSSANGIQLLPFLDILTCTMGALVTLLFAFARFGQQQVVQVVDAKQAAAEAAAAAEVEDLQWRASVLRDSRAKTEADLGDARLELSHLEDHLRRLRERAEQIHQAAIALENADPQASQAQAGKELAKLKERIALSKRELELARQNAAGKPTTYSIVPYAGPNQTRRRPIYLECRAEGVVLEPEGIVFTDSDFAGPLGPSNPLAAAVRAAREYMAATDPNGFEQIEPYPLLVVRPDAIPQYYAARSALVSFGSQFGYELIGADKKLKFPDPDPKMAEVITNVVAEARIRQEQLIAAAPKHYRKAKTFHVKSGGGGIEEEPNSRVAQDDRNPYRGIGRGGGKGGKGSWGNGKGNDGNGGNGNGAGGTTTGTTTGTTVGTTTGTVGGTGNGTLYGGGGGTGLALGGNGAGGAGGIGTGGNDPLGTGNMTGGGDKDGPGMSGPGGYGNGPAGRGGYAMGNGPNGRGAPGGAPGGYPPGGGYGQGGAPAGAPGSGYGQNTPPGAGGPGTPGAAYGMGKAPGAGGTGNSNGQAGPGRAGGVPGAGLSALADDSGGAAGPGGPGAGQTGAGTSDDTADGVGQGETDGNGGDGINGNSPGAPGQVGSGGGGSSGGRLARGGQLQPGSNDAPGGTSPGSGTPQTTTLQGTGGATAGNTNGTGSGTGPGGGGLGGLGGKPAGNLASTMPDGQQKRSNNGGPAIPQTRVQQVTNANAYQLGGGADDTGPSNNSMQGNTTAGGSAASGGNSNRSTSTGQGGGSSNSSQSSSSQSGGSMSGSSGPQSGQQGAIGMPNINIGQQPQDSSQTGRHGKKHGGQRPPGWGLPDAPDTSASVARPVVIECWSDKLAIIDEDGKSIAKQIPLGQHTEDSVDELVSSVLQQTKLWGVAGKGLHWRPTLTMRVAPEARARFEELQKLLADSGLEVKESTHKPSIAGKSANRLRK
ncbi:MAG TPA: hypothetical protein VHY91_11155 [Pirellulales bacterium]|jgi:hypothetical protein|nr:hypothetical protein [Pirellulales bacterium]